MGVQRSKQDVTCGNHAPISGDRYGGTAVAAPAGKPLGRGGRSPTSPLLIIMQNIYAATPKSLIYHLLAEYHRTLCGLYIVGDLHLFAGIPKDRILCKHCESAAQERDHTADFPVK